MDQAGHFAGLVPLLALPVLGLAGRALPWRWWLVAGALAVSFVVDTVTFWRPGLFWLGSYYWLPVQIGLVLYALAPTIRWRGALAVGMVPLAVVSHALSAPGPDLLITGVGSAGVLWLSWDSPLMPALWLYFGLGSVAYMLWMVTLPDTRYLYLTCRLAAVGAFALGAATHGTRKEN